MDRYLLAFGLYRFGCIISHELYSFATSKNLSLALSSHGFVVTGLNAIFIEFIPHGIHRASLGIYKETLLADLLWPS